MVSTICTGIRIVLAWSAIARVMDCLIHHVLIKYYRDSVKLLNLNYVNYRIKTLSQSFDACPDASERRRILTDLSVYQNMLKSLK